MAGYTKVAVLEEIPEGAARAVEAGGTAFALYNVGGRIYATRNTCPHRGGPLGEGDLDAAVITCPWHGFRFDVTSGACLTNPALALGCVAVRIEGRDVLVDL
ncbi:MAG: Rieske (2Fe-2S) protein [Candidatus Polarisedimenticolia bacterium]